MRIGIPRERKTLEHRVAVTPSGAKELIEAGHVVLIENNAGAASFFSNEEYIASGCTIVESLKQLWGDSELIVKVKEPHVKEYEFFRKDLILFDYLHLAGLPKVTNALLESGMTSLAYELVEPSPRKFPLLEPMSEVAGKLAVQNGANALLSQHGGRGKLLGAVNGVNPGKVVIVGGGISGTCSCEVALGMGAIVTVLDINETRLNELKSEMKNHPHLKLILSNPQTLAEEIKSADLLIGAVLIPGAKAPYVVSKEMVASMKKGSVIVDISIDQGGCIETSKVTSLKEPTFEEFGVIHYCVPNMPSQTAITSTQALTAATLPYIKLIADKGLKAALESDQALLRSLSTIDGKLTSLPVAESLGLEYAKYTA